MNTLVFKPSFDDTLLHWMKLQLQNTDWFLPHKHWKDGFGSYGQNFEGCCVVFMSEQGKTGSDHSSVRKHFLYIWAWTFPRAVSCVCQHQNTQNQRNCGTPEPEPEKTNERDSRRVIVYWPQKCLVLEPQMLFWTINHFNKITPLLL